MPASPAVLDLYKDCQIQTDKIFLAIEIALMIFVLLASGVIWIFYNQALSKKQSLFFQNEYQDAIAQLAKGIRKQLDRWQLSVSEKRVANAFIRGCPNKQTAVNPGRSGKTICNKPTAIYETTVMIGRNDLAAIYLSELLPNPDEG